MVISGRHQIHRLFKIPRSASYLPQSWPWIPANLILVKQFSFLCLNCHEQVEYLEARRQRVEDYENQLQMLRVQDAEEYNMVKIKLETDVQVM